MTQEMKALTPIKVTILYGTFVHACELGELSVNFNGFICVDRNGIITCVLKDIGADKSDEDLIKLYSNHFHTSIDASEVLIHNFNNDKTKFIIPGFIDTHIHASQYPNVGVGLGIPLLDWLSRYTFKLENQFLTSSPDDSKTLQFATSVYSQVIAKTLSNGTTCASYFTTIDPETTNLFADLLLKFGQRGFVGKVCMNDNATYEAYQEDYDTCVQTTEQCCQHINKINPVGEQLVAPIITPRFAPVCTEELLQYLGDFAETNKLPIQTHISENLQEIELVKSLFPDSDNYASVYESHNLLTSSTILAHAVHLDDNECKLIKSKGCSISHCPTSNSFISSGEAPIKKYLYDYNINVSLGTDLSGGFEPSILAIMKHTILVSHHLAMKSKKDFDRISIAEAIYLATQAGAKAVGLGDTVGSFEVGKKYDSQLIDLASPDSNISLFDWQVPLSEDDNETKQGKFVDLLGKWIFCGDDRNCIKVWCNGRLVVNKNSDKWVMVH